MMGKRQKLSRGYSSGFVPDYRHSVNVAGESEGFGSCGRADSEDSCTRKRKRAAWNNQGLASFDIPSQVFSFSNLSPQEKKNLEARLRADLQKVQTFQKKVLMNFPEAVASSSTTNKQQNQNQRPNGCAAPPQKAQCGASGKLGTVKQGPGPVPASGNSSPVLMNECRMLLERLMSHKFASVFNSPVDVVRWNIPDYFSIIKHPMDLGTIKSKLTSGAYSNPRDFFSDVKLTFTNAMTYNPPKNDVHVMARALSKYFEGRWKDIEKKISDLASQSVITREKSHAKLAQHSKMRVPPRKTAPVSSTYVETVKKSMSKEDRQKLSDRLVSLSTGLPDHIINFLKRHNSNQVDEDEIELDIEALGDETLFELQNLLDKHFKDQRVPGAACAMEVVHDSVISSSYMPVCRGNDSPEEDVDIGDSDVPMLCYPPVEIERDNNIRDHGDSTSSSDSGTSSSESDSAGSSNGHREAGKASLPSAERMEKLVSHALVDQHKSDPMNLADTNCIPSKSSQPQQNAHPKTVSRTDNAQKLGDATSGRKVSPEKLYQNALKVNRFAETILRAREKTLDKCGKGDPEKLQSQKEEFERLQREEKERLKEEARIAEEARKQAQAAAAAEAKRQREIDREAARQALLRIEKTVEIDESSRFLKDLEMLQCNATGGLHKPVEDNSPDIPLDGFGGFNLGGSNPLEKLGLFMKVDEEEEEDIERCQAIT